MKKRSGLAVLAVCSCISLADAQPVVSRTCDNGRFLADQQRFDQTGPTRVDMPEHICGRVVGFKPQARHTRSGVHSFFFVDIAQGRPVRIVSDLDRMNAPRWPWVKVGDQVEIVGRYYYDSARSQGIDWTHHGTGRRWAMPGYVIVNGTRYE